jgi:hypothetical protein
MPDFSFQSLYRPYIPDNVGSWKALSNDERIFSFSQDGPLNPKDIISIENSKVPRGLTPLESSFSLSDVGNKEKQKEEELRKKVVETISMNIRTPESSTNVKINVQCSGKEEMRFVELLGGFQNVFTSFDKDLCGFDPGLIQHTMKPARKKQGLVSSALEATVQRELGNFLRSRINVFVHPERVPNWVLDSKSTDHIRTCIHLHTFIQDIMRNPSPPLNIGMIMQQVVELQLKPLLDEILGYNKIKVKGTKVHKTTFITNYDTMSYKCSIFGLLDAGTAFKNPIHTTFNELVTLHIYVDDLIVCVKGLIITSEFQVLGPFQIAFVLDTNSYVFKDL